jgi:hypothetical protein
MNSSKCGAFSVNQIVRGAVCGTFVILAFRSVGDTELAVLKEIHPVTQEPKHGELCLPVDCIRYAA